VLNPFFTKNLHFTQMIGKPTTKYNTTDSFIYHWS